MKRKKEEKEGESGISQKERICPVRGEEINGANLPEVLGGDCVVSVEGLPIPNSTTPSSLTH